MKAERVNCFLSLLRFKKCYLNKGVTKESQLPGYRFYHVIFISTRQVEVRQSYDLLRNIG